MFRKRGDRAPAGYFAWEAGGLRWLAEAAASGGAPVVEVLAVGTDHLDLGRLDEVRPSASAAEELGRRLARTHAAGAPAYGAGPPGWDGDGWFGPLHQPLGMALGQWDRWGDFYAEARVRPLVRLARDQGLYAENEVAVFDAVCSRLVGGELDTDDAPARLHGDLWSGNLMWTAGGVTLIDPAAHGGHRENDLALLHLFGAPHLARIVAAYDEARPLAEGWRDRVGLHQLHCLLVHAVVFGGGYVRQARDVARRYA